MPPGKAKYCSEECKRSEQNHRTYLRRKQRSAEPAQPAVIMPQPQSPFFYRPNPSGTGGQLRLGDSLTWIGDPDLVTVIKTDSGFAVYRSEDRRAASRDPQEVQRGHHHPDGQPIPPFIRLAQRAAFVMSIEHFRKYIYEVCDGAIIVQTIEDK